MKNFLLKILVLIIIACVAIACGSIWFKSNSKVKPGTIDIYEGASVRTVADVLELNGLIKSADVFYYYIRGKQLYLEMAPWTSETFEVSFKPGKFTLESEDFDSLIAELNEIDNAEKNDIANEKFVTIPEGYTISQMATLLSERSIVNEKAFLDMTNDKDYYNELRKKYIWLPEYNSEKINQLEGYLHANTYDFNKDMLPHEIIEQMIEETNSYYKENKLKIIDSGYSYADLITLASVVEKESKFKEDRPKVAQVFYNRLVKGMKLESDITAAYANQEHKVFMTYDDIDTESPYNTYKTEGLPLGPINAPSTESLNAVIHPEGAEFKAIYFYARPNGETFYAITFSDHEKNIAKYEKEWLELNKKQEES